MPTPLKAFAFSGIPRFGRTNISLPVNNFVTLISKIKVIIVNTVESGYLVVAKRRKIITSYGVYELHDSHLNRPLPTTGLSQ
jgi:hypothetical protein